jgi:hypothetical protein
MSHWSIPTDGHIVHFDIPADGLILYFNILMQTILGAIGALCATRLDTDSHATIQVFVAVDWAEFHKCIYVAL